jgi:hypothetical protein
VVGGLIGLFKKLSGLKIGELFISIVFHMTEVADQIYCQEPLAPDRRSGHGGLGDCCFSFFLLSGGTGGYF